MDFEFTKEEKALQEEVREFIKKESTPEMLKETEDMGDIYGAPEGRKIIQKMAAKGWLTPTWPKEYGGLGVSDVASYMIREEMGYHGLPFGFVAAHMAGPTILRFGSDEMKKKWLPRIASGELEFALGYTEPQAGSDLSALNLRAEDKGDYFLLNGTKLFNTSCHIADCHWLACRTDFDVAKHKGVSMMIVDLKSPGITISPLITMAGWQTNEVVYEDVRVPKENLVGEKNKGFYYLMAALDFERMFPLGRYRRVFDELVEYTKETIVDGKAMSKDPLIRQKLAQLSTEIEVTRLLYYQLAHILDKGGIPNYQSSMEKTFATECAQRIVNVGMDVLGLYGQLKEGSKWAQLKGKVEKFYRTSIVETIYAGTSEIQRNIIAQRGLKLPR
ncbi:MAG: acyl-CoA dehydrogenase [Deltaproteobacteria bacterium CG12_big_fil_rev_8_21_14_0_65_43_10]|nr:MAG: acyl-CoA dehydrogenase [Deltaproteobacteria bacterium CG12_big_fil_rev_8_21_14_0_65_43_10]PIU84694.1 MAG: acyl-CoA dehydrogenase [Deltaproteobacteria bacterium CG06_land_8_20_14_3_00_44_19]PIX23995.1 MAG: acyl-CoA dehydrogenase [Deltaproteobacteria bacterium CG_4_8_14_3_um_filter_43_13]PIZ20412.1 MAG: acyl-CoA dehydrogenase [Deltaproteobacteria bacterium CG_4_10_14_0_8_um_filter_43_12]HCX88938.1 acyl-CoA dehydrogenase [Deltaproteobacteria bacterium]